jgi:hypothetical protein
MNKQFISEVFVFFSEEHGSISQTDEFFLRNNMFVSENIMFLLNVSISSILQRWRF